MARERKVNRDDVRFSLAPYPELRILSERVERSMDGHGALAREVRRMLRLALLAEEAGLSESHLDAIASGRMHVASTVGASDLPVARLPPKVPLSPVQAEPVMREEVVHQPPPSLRTPPQVPQQSVSQDSQIAVKQDDLPVSARPRPARSATDPALSFLA